MIGEGRARPTSEADPGARGSAAGVFAHQAKRERRGRAAPRARRCGEAIRAVAEELGERPERLLMVDYQQRVADDDEPARRSQDVFAAYGSWKRARREAAELA